MITILGVGFLAGLVTGISPCVLPVLPIVLAGGVTGGVTEGVTDESTERGAVSGGKGSPSVAARRVNRGRPYAVVGGLVVSFSVLILVGGSLLRALHLPQDFLEDLGIALLLVLGIGLVVPGIGELLERPFARLGGRRIARDRGGFVLGLSLGLVFVPCAGPVLAAIDAVVANRRIGLEAVLLTAAYAVGLALPLLVIALLGQRTAAAWPLLRRRAVGVRRVAGVLLVGMAMAIAFNWTNGLTTVPGYTSSLQRSIEQTTSVEHQLQVLQGEKPGRFTKPVAVSAAGGAKSGSASPSNRVTQAVVHAGLPDLGTAPTFTGITTWLHTPGDQALTLHALRGKVVLIDFWTYSCINCERSLPHVEAWYSDYQKDGFEVVGVHTPEFPFEYVPSNVKAASARLGVHYPVAIDDGYHTWDAYSNQSWPAEYLVDQNGNVRDTSIGEGQYATTEKAIRRLLTAGGVRTLPAPVDVPDQTPTEPLTTETYLGSERFTALRSVGTPAVQAGGPTTYQLTHTLTQGQISVGGTWTQTQWDLVAGGNSKLALSFGASVVYLVLGGTGTVTVKDDGRSIGKVKVHGVPDIYTMVQLPTYARGTLTLSFTTGVQAYDFTFG